MNFKTIVLQQDQFPEKLKRIRCVPRKLYAIGNISLLYEDSFGIVGTRHISEYGKRNCRYFTKEFSLREINTVSGLALGTDTIVHEETINNNGKTIAVLGCGFNNIFPIENKKLFERILLNDGLVLSEYSENEMWDKSYFPKRNRIIAAISEGILIIEAAYRSGTTITAKNAKEQGKKVFAVPGIIGTTGGVGVNNLIKKGADLVTNINDIIDNYPQFMNKLRKDCSYKKEIKKEYRMLYDIINKNCYSIDALLERVNISVPEVLQLLTCMEMDKIIYVDNCGIYKTMEE